MSLTPHDRVTKQTGKKHGCSAADKSPAHHSRRPAYAATLPRQIYELSFWRSKKVYESSHETKIKKHKL